MLLEELYSLNLSPDMGLLFFFFAKITSHFMKRYSKGGFKMKNYVKYAVIGVAGYLIGFYEMKYKVIKAIANGAIEREMKEFEEEQEEES